MPIYVVNLIYRDDTTGLSWSVTNWQDAASYVAAKNQANVWNSAYLLVCSNTVKLTLGRVSDVSKYRDITLYGPTAWTNSVGTQTDPCTEIGTYLMVRCPGDPAAGQGISYWKLHGIASTFIVGSRWILTGASMVALESACFNYFRQWRPDATPNLPAVPSPVPFGTTQLWPNAYFRRLGRPLTVPGQQFSYRR